MKRNPHEGQLPPGTLAQLAGSGDRDRKQRRMEQLIAEYGGLKNVPASMRGIIAKSKRFSTPDERPRRK